MTVQERDVAAVLERYRQPVLGEMRRVLDRPGIEHVRLMRYHLGWEDAAGEDIDATGGKMLRPALCLLACEAAGGGVERALPAAAAIELLHNFTLIHDDIEDGSRTRHGRPTLWTLVGVPLAINAGDGLFVLARRTLLDLADRGVPAERVLDAVRLLDEACVALCEGQHLDLGFESRGRVGVADYERMIAGKTAALLGASMAIGGIAAGADAATVSGLEEAGRALGMAFQAQDDVLGIWGEPAVTGKPVADDIRSRKKSLPVVHAFERLSGAALAELERVYGADADVPGDDVERVLALLDEAGARAAAESYARRELERALALLRALPLDEGRRVEIERIGGYFVERER